MLQTSRRARPRRPDAGFTILEVALAASIMALGIATSVLTMQSGFKAIDVARGTTLASQILQSEMERLRMMSWSGIGALPATEDFDGATYFSSNPEVANRYRITRTVTADASRPDDAKTITISVTWRSSDGRRHSRSFQSLYVKNGLYDYYYTLARP